MTVAIMTIATIVAAKYKTGRFDLYLKGERFLMPVVPQFVLPWFYEKEGGP